MWWLVAVIAVVLGAILDLKKKGPQISAFAMALIFAFLVGLGYFWLLLIKVYN